MTTQHLQQEHGDVETSVAEYSAVLETMLPSVIDITAQTEVGTSSSEEMKPQESSKEESTETTEDGATSESVETPEDPQVDSCEHGEEIHETAPIEPDSLVPAVPTEAEEIRPFIDYIEEFRLAEAARSQHILHESQGEAFTLLSTVETMVTNEEQKDALQPSETNGLVNGTETVSPLNGEIGLAMPTPPAVSPLLRPATRFRAPRHAIGRHPQFAIPEVTLSTALPAKDDPMPQPETVSEEQAADVAPPKAARRYRFDRPNRAAIDNGVYKVHGGKATNGAVSAASSKSILTQPPIDVTTTGDAKSVEDVIDAEKTQPMGYDPASLENAGPTITEPGRRRQPAKEAHIEPPALPEETAGEDLSALDKAARRRRRHRANAGSEEGGKSAAAPDAPQQSPLLISPISIAQPPSAYSIVSGYTVSQMNQGNDEVGPFMGPEPSPARGSGIGRDVHAPTARLGAHRAGPAGRGNEAGLSSTALTQFATIVSQAIEAQTDRIVAELHRVNQAPASVSVSLPPFPSTERVGVFVDVANLLYSARTLRVAVDFGKLLDFLRGNRRLVRAHAYCPTSPQAGDEQMFLQAVKGLGYRITTKNYKTFSSGAKKADLDLDLCMDVVRLVDGRAVDCVVLLSGDSDFMPMLDYCSDHGVRVEVAAFDEAMSATLRQSCDLFINLSMLDEIRA